MIKKMLTAIVIFFLLPAFAAIGAWAAKDHPVSWSNADWSSAAILPEPSASPDAATYIMSARTGGMKGALAVHTWIVTKRSGAARYTRYEKVGWGDPIRINNRPPDGRWYSNEPQIITAIHGANAEVLIGKIEAAIAAYPYGKRGGYRLWPGPNSNSFVAFVLRAVPELEAQLPVEAVGRDYQPLGKFVTIAPDWSNVHVSLGGITGLAFGKVSGFEIQFLGLVFGFDFMRPAIKLPGFGRIGLPAEQKQKV